MFPLDQFKQSFIDHAIAKQAVALDIGAAYGVVTLPLIAAGLKVIAVDLEQNHLNDIANKVDLKFKNNLTLKQGKFPNGIDFNTESFDCILCSHVFEFLSPEEVTAAIKKLYTWLKPSGKVFVICFTPYHKFTEAFISLFEQRVKNNEPNPGWLENANSYVMQTGLLPNKLHLFDQPILKKYFSAAGFVVEICEYLSFTDLVKPDYWTLDGREQVTLIASKD